MLVLRPIKIKGEACLEDNQTRIPVLGAPRSPA
jgi:hypothetical protein